MLERRHEDQLHESGIAYREWLGLESTPQGLAFTYPDIVKKQFRKFQRVRLDHPAGDGQKYSQPKGSGVVLYFPPTFAFCPQEKYSARWWAALEDTDDIPRDVVIVEGEKKALALQQALGARTIVIGLGGVWNWGKKDDDGDRKLVKDFNHVKNWKDRRVYICFDSDVNDNPHVERAEFMLQMQLQQQLKVRARLITLNPGDNNEKVGIDDLVYEYGESFPVLWKELKKDSVSGVRYRIPDPITGRELCNREWEFEKTIVGDGENCHLLVEGGASFVHAGSGVGKTYFLLQLSASIAGGRPFLGFDCSRRRVLFLQQELSNGWFSRRVRRLRSVFGSVVDDIQFLSGDFTLATVDRFKNAKMHLRRLERLIIRTDAQFVVLDPLQGYYDMSESSTDHAREFMKGITKVAKATGAHIALSHHDRKDTTGASISQMRGGSPLSDLADTVIGVKRAPLFERADNGKLVKVKDEFGEIIYHPTNLILNYDKVRHNEASLPERTYITRMRPLEDGTPNPFFEEADDNESYLAPAPF